jgi:hypothetical protein
LYPHHVLVYYATFFLFCQPFKNPRNQNPGNQEKDSTPQGWGRCSQVGPVLLFFLQFFVVCFFPTSLGGFVHRKQEILKNQDPETVIGLGIHIGEVRVPCTVVDVFTGNAANCALPSWRVL